jgi:hypothetical protein
MELVADLRDLARAARIWRIRSANPAIGMELVADLRDLARAARGIAAAVNGL